MLFEREIQLNEFLISYLKLLMKGIGDDILFKGQLDGVNSPGWCLGHLATEGDKALNVIGIARSSPESWDNLFLMKATGIDDKTIFPKKSELTAAVSETYQKLRSAAANFDEAFIGAECPSQFLKPVLPTQGLLFAHMLTTHVAMHAGNIAAWRRTHGFGPLLG